MRLKNKKAFVTAAGQGIGKAIAEKFFHFGSEVLAVDINEGMLTQLKVSKSLCVDVRDAEAINKAKNTIYNLDILGVDRSTTPDVGAYQHIIFD